MIRILTTSQIDNNQISAPEILRFSRRFEKALLNGEIDRSKLKALKIAVLGSYSTQHFVLTLKYILYLKGFLCEIYESDYNGINIDVLNKNSALYQFNPNIVILLPYYTDIKKLPSLLDNNEHISECLNDNMKYYSSLWAALNKISGIQIFQSNIVIPSLRQLGELEGNRLFSRETFLKQLNLEFIKQKPDNLMIVDLEHLASDIGKSNWFDFSGYFLNKVGFSLNYIGQIAASFARLIAVLKGNTRKCLVLDLDNTLWGGIVGEDGVNGIQLDPNDAIGEAYRFFQTYILSLKERGVILAVCSKNDEEIAKSPFLENPYMILSLSDISCFIANWNDKAQNIRLISETLNIGIDSLVFIDDNRIERELIKMMVPEVLVVELPEEPENYAAFIDSTGAFDCIELTAEDLKRCGSYHINEERNRSRASFDDYNEYLQSLEMQALVSVVTETQKQRFTQLINKTNQFNLRSIRYTDAEIENLSKNINCDLLYMDFKDKFENYGIISCVILKYDKDVCFIDTWVMSCRVLKRTLENFIFDNIIKYAKARNCKVIKAEYISTAKNKPVISLLDDLGFVLNYNTENLKCYNYELSNIKTDSKYFITKWVDI